MFNESGSDGTALGYMLGMNSGNHGRDNDFGGNGIWAILLLALLRNGNGLFGQGNNGGSGNCGNCGGYGFVPYPVPAFQNGWGGSYPVNVATTDDIQRGFDNDKVVSKLDGISNGLCDGFYATTNAITTASAAAQNTMLQGFAGINTGIVTAANNIQDAVQADTIANMQNTFALQTAINGVNITNMQNQNALQTQIANCCCENREGQANIKYQMATDTCAINSNLCNVARDITDNQNANARAIIDAINAQSIAAKDAKIAEQGQQIFALQLAASQQAQNNYIVDALAPKVPVAAYTVPNPFACNYNYNAYGCGGCGNCGGCGRSQY